ncbi:MAG: hypothetical protein KAI47_11200, partial [Deltaproteobacteria bacterium]|nr:hypothetical protein [Deltaproteobacteria bacterium]
MKSRSRILFAFPLVVMLIAAPRPAEAKIFEVWGTAMGGGIFGDGSATSDRDFFKWAGGGGAGVEVGVRFLFLGAWIDYIRFFGGDAGANLMSINLGGDTTVSLTKHLKLVLRL